MNNKIKNLLLIVSTILMFSIIGCSEVGSSNGTSGVLSEDTLEPVPKILIVQDSSAEELEAPPEPPSN